MSIIQNRSRVPPGGAFTYQQPESGEIFSSHSLAVLKSKVKAHRHANGYPVGLMFEREVEDGVCARHPEICGEAKVADESLPTVPQMMTNFAKAMVKWARSGFKTVDDSTAALRAETCSQCEYWGRFKANGTLRCKKCGCSGKKFLLATESCPIGKW
jgi:hypothetical protein